MRQGKKDYFFRVELVILIGTKEGELTKTQIDEEISMMCSRLEYKNGEPNNIHVSKKLIVGN